MLPIQHLVDDPKQLNSKFPFPSQIAVPDVLEAAKDADVLVFVIPHQFIKNICKPLVGQLKPTAVGISLIKVSGHCQA